MIYLLTNQERNTILAALRLYQRHLNLEYGSVPEAITEIATDGGEHDPLLIEDIDELCEALNGAVGANGESRDLTVEVSKVLSGAREVERLIQQTFADPVVEEDENADEIVVEEG